eukprot:771118_1
MQPCFYFHNRGTCRYGVLCRFSHHEKPYVRRRGSKRQRTQSPTPTDTTPNLGGYEWSVCFKWRDQKKCSTDNCLFKHEGEGDPVSSGSGECSTGPVFHSGSVRENSSSEGGVSQKSFCPTDNILEHLPLCILEHIASFTEFPDFSQLSCTSTRVQKLVNTILPRQAVLAIISPKLRFVTCQQLKIFRFQNISTFIGDSGISQDVIFQIIIRCKRLANLKSVMIRPNTLRKL